MEKIPYDTTSVPIERSQKEINDLLKKYGVTKRAWFIEDGKFYQIAFIYEEDGKEFGIKIQLDVLKKKVKNKIKFLPESTMRMLYYFIKSKLEGVKFGLESIKDAFMPYVMIDQERTLKDFCFSQLPENLNFKLLPEKSE